MSTVPFSRRVLTVAALTGLGLAGRLIAGPLGSEAAEGLSHTSESIHQKVHFGASCRRVYEALTSAQQFDALTRLSDGATLLAAPDAQATAISPEVGGAFTLFGGYITGRHLQMLPGERLVQAWRAGSWDPGDYSVVSFRLATDAAGCTLVFDHGGFPDGQGASLAFGWRVHYWEPLSKLLAQH